MAVRDRWTLLWIALGSLATALFGHFRWGSDWFEVSAFVTAAVSIYLLAKEELWGWPIGIVSSGIYVWVFYAGGLPADMCLNIFYVGMLVHGWWYWKRGERPEGHLLIRNLNANGWVWVVVATAASTAIHYPLVSWAKGKAVFWDSSLASGSYVAQFLQNTKYLQNWHIWVAINLMYVPLYISRSFYLTAVLFVVLAGLAVLGQNEWVRSVSLRQAKLDT